MVSRGELKANPAKGVSPHRKLPRHLPKILMSTTLTACWTSILTLAVRDRAMLEVMYGAGCVYPNWLAL
ncbi:hypothetical protein KCP69_02400 [Salmonella enterica subsp. enterica]|nr:hypothetical protein KCP69_02400 [Salmonella enterica subsp. enterica]